MLSLDLIPYCRKGKRVVPHLIPPDDTAHGAVAATLLELYQEAEQNAIPRGELEALSNSIAAGSDDPAFATALNALLLQHCRFSTEEEDTDYAARRRELFQRSFASLAAAAPDLTPEAHRSAVLSGGSGADFDLYGDLPELERLTAAPSGTPEEWLKRYNLALVQGLAANATELVVTTCETDPAKLRKVLKYMKFFRLLVLLSKTKDDGLRLTVSGPYALFEANRKYAVALASALPAVLALSNWNLSAEIKLKRGKGTLTLDQTAPLGDGYRGFSSYIPEEIRLFHQAFSDKGTSWKIVGGTPFLDGGKQQLILPDFSFQREDGGTILHLELFHRWHAAQLEARLTLLEEHPELPLLLGIDRSIANDEAFRSITERYPKCARKLYRFRDFPGVANTLKLLESNASALI